MVYGEHSFGSCYIPKVLGIYERECYPAITNQASARSKPLSSISALPRRAITRLVFASGIRRRVIAFEMEETGLKAALRGGRPQWLPGSCENLPGGFASPRD